MDLNWLEIALAFALTALVLAEFRDPQFRRSWYRDPKRVRRNLGFAVASVVVMIALKRINAAVDDVSILALMDWRALSLLAVPACFLVAELTGWLLHYVKHRNAFLWRFHFQHHREHEYNVWLTAHTHGLEVIVSGALMALVLSIWGFSVLTIELYLVYYGFMKAFQHSAFDYSFGVLDRVFITPRYHRLHHEVNSRCNYGVTLTLFDVLFRTARWPVEAPSAAARYGVGPEEALPFGFWKEMTFFLSAFARKPLPPTNDEVRYS